MLKERQQSSLRPSATADVTNVSSPWARLRVVSIGHTAVTCAVIAVLWIYYPKWRPLYALAVLGVNIGLIGANYHFVSDVIAGGFVGILSLDPEYFNDLAGARIDD